MLLTLFQAVCHTTKSIAGTSSTNQTAIKVFNERSSRRGFQQKTQHSSGFSRNRAALEVFKRQSGSNGGPPGSTSQSGLSTTSATHRPDNQPQSTSTTKTTWKQDLTGCVFLLQDRTSGLLGLREFLMQKVTHQLPLFIIENNLNLIFVMFLYNSNSRPRSFTLKNA